MKEYTELTIDILEPLWYTKALSISKITVLLNKEYNFVLREATTLTRRAKFLGLPTRSALKNIMKEIEIVGNYNNDLELKTAVFDLRNQGYKSNKIAKKIGLTSGQLDRKLKKWKLPPTAATGKYNNIKEFSEAIHYYRSLGNSLINTAKYTNATKQEVKYRIFKDDIKFGLVVTPIVYKNGKPSQDSLLHILYFNKNTKLLHYKEHRGTRSRKNNKAGHIKEDGYQYIRLEGTIYPASHLHICMVTGEYPIRKVYYINNNRQDCSFNNLRIGEEPSDYIIRRNIQTPPWSDLEKIKRFKIYRDKFYPNKHIDHIHPLIMGGLHVSYNLQLISASDNSRKGFSLDFSEYTQTPIYLIDVII